MARAHRVPPAISDWDQKTKKETGQVNSITQSPFPMTILARPDASPNSSTTSFYAPNNSYLSPDGAPVSNTSPNPSNVTVSAAPTINTLATQIRSPATSTLALVTPLSL